MCYSLLSELGVHETLKNNGVWIDDQGRVHSTHAGQDMILEAEEALIIGFQLGVKATATHFGKRYAGDE